MIRIDDILDLVLAYNPEADLDLIKKAYVFSAKVHMGQVRLSGEPYLVHPLEVAAILAQLKLDTARHARGYLHALRRNREEFWPKDSISGRWGHKNQSHHHGVFRGESG